MLSYTIHLSAAYKYRTLSPTDEKSVTRDEEAVVHVSHRV